jgi:hypothetical protein
MGRNNDDEEDYRFVHMSYQEYLTGREYSQKLMQNQFSTKTMKAVFGSRPLDAFSNVKQHLVLELLAGILLPEQRMVCLAVMAGGKARPLDRKSMATVCTNTTCIKKTTDGSGYCLLHRKQGELEPVEAKIYWAGIELQGGVKLQINNKDFGLTGMKALVPYLEENTRLQYLDLSRSELENEGAKCLAEVLSKMRCVANLLFDLLQGVLSYFCMCYVFFLCHNF